MHRCMWVGFGLCLLAVGAQAEMITLGIDVPSGSTLAVDAGTSNSDPLLVTVSNNVNTDDPADRMAAWQFLLRIEPDAGATGQVGFNPGNRPTPYVFDGVGTFGFTAAPMGSGSQLFAFDATAFPVTGVQVTTTAANLVVFDVHASADASGTFGIYAVPGAGNTEWTDVGTGGVQVFANVLPGGGQVRIGEIVVVPEPTSLAICVVGVLGLVYRRSRH